MVIGFGDLRKGTTIELEGVPYKVEQYSQQKMQQRAPVYRIKLRNLLSGQLIERSFSGYGVKLNVAPVENRTVQLLYEDDLSLWGKVERIAENAAASGGHALPPEARARLEELCGVNPQGGP